MRATTRATARITAVRGTSGVVAKALLDKHAADDRWIEELAELRSGIDAGPAARLMPESSAD